MGLVVGTTVPSKFGGGTTPLVNVLELERTGAVPEFGVLRSGPGWVALRLATAGGTAKPINVPRCMGVASGGGGGNDPGLGNASTSTWPQSPEFGGWSSLVAIWSLVRPMRIWPEGSSPMSSPYHYQLGHSSQIFAVSSRNYAGAHIRAQRQSPFTQLERPTQQEGISLAGRNFSCLAGPFGVPNLASAFCRPPTRDGNSD